VKAIDLQKIIKHHRYEVEPAIARSRGRQLSYQGRGAGTPVAAFTARPALQVYLRHRIDTFINPLVYTFWGNQDPSIMTMSSALSE
jgi:hypothetical protein